MEHVRFKFLLLDVKQGDRGRPWAQLNCSNQNPMKKWKLKLNGLTNKCKTQPNDLNISYINNAKQTISTASTLHETAID